MLTNITETRIVSGVMASSSSCRSIMPSRLTPRRVTVNPISSRKLTGACTAGCSICVVMMCFPILCIASAVPTNAQLLDSVPPEVK